MFVYINILVVSKLLHLLSNITITEPSRLQVHSEIKQRNRHCRIEDLLILGRERVRDLTGKILRKFITRTINPTLC